MQPVELICVRCGAPFTVPFWMVTKGRKFCSAACIKQDPMETMLERVRKEENGCWTYTGFLDHGGYGQIKCGKKIHNVHRLMWVLHNKKEVPEGEVVRHTCKQNRACINPDHLITGTPKQNVHDSINQGTFVITRGEDRSTAKLTEKAVRKIRELRGPTQTTEECGYSYADLGKMFGVSGGLIWAVTKHKQWKHVKS